METQKGYYPFWSASMDGTITSAAKKREATETGTTHSSRGFLHQGVSYFIIFLYSCIYLKNTSSFTKKSHVSSGKIPQVVSQVGVNCFEKFKGDPSKPYCSACCKGLLAKAASKSPGSRSKQEKIHDPQLWKLQNTFKKTVKLFKSEENFASEKGYISRHRNSADCQWFGRHLKSPLQISFLFPFQQPSFCFTTHILSWFHASPKKNPKQNQHSSHFQVSLVYKVSDCHFPTAPPNQHRSLYYQPKQSTIRREILEIDHRFVLFDSPPNMISFWMTPEQPNQPPNSARQHHKLPILVAPPQ